MLRLNLDGPAQCVHDALANRQSQTGTSDLAAIGIVYPEKRMKDIGQSLFRNTQTMVVYGNRDFGGGAFEGSNLNEPAGRGIFEGVG